jgi:predicted enzyme related to lactoylglutathione lyase
MDLKDSKIEQLLIPVSDFAAGTAFYRDTLGLPFLFSAPPQMSFFQCGGVRLLVGSSDDPKLPKRCATIYFGVPDIHAVHANLVSRGVNFQQKPHVVHRTDEIELWLAEFLDPDGNNLALMSTVRIA